MGKQLNYKQIFARNMNIGKQLLEICPSLNEGSGIYILMREESGNQLCYIGQAINGLRRMVSHVQGYNQRIDISIKKRGFYNKDNPFGWKLSFKNFPESQLDEKERYYISEAINKGWELYNITSGGQNSGKTDINERKPAKGYMDGIKQGKRALRRELNSIIEKHLDITLKKDNKISQKALEKFYKLLSNEE